MADTEIHMQALLKAVNDMSASFSRYAKLAERGPRLKSGGQSGRDLAAARLSADLSRISKGAKLVEDSTARLTSKFSVLAGSAETLSRSFGGIITKVPLLGVALASLYDGANGLSRTYSEMMGRGQSFGGSMIEMGRQAAASGLSLSDFADMVKTHGAVVAALGGAAGDGAMRLGQLQKGVRDNIREFGFLGLSLRDISELSGDYAETLRRQGAAADMNAAKEARNIAQFSEEITQFAAMTGTNRRQIAKMTMDLLKEGTIATRLAINGSEDQRRALERSVAFFSSMPGIAGEMLGKMIGQSFANGGAIFTEQAETFIQAGAGGLLGVFDDIRRQIETGAGASIEDLQAALDRIHQFDEQNRVYLMVQARAGNSNAQQVLAMLSQMRNITAEGLAEQMERAKQQGKITSIFSKLEDAFTKVSSSFREGFLGAFEDLVEGDSGNALKEAVDRISEIVKALGSSLGAFFAGMFKGDGLGNTIKTINAVGSGMIGVFSTLSTVISALSPVFRGIIGVVGTVATIFNRLTQHLGPFETGLVALASFFGGKVLITKVTEAISNMFRRVPAMNVHAEVINVNGSRLGGGPDLPAPGGSGRRSILRQRGAVGRAARSLARVMPRTTRALGAAGSAVSHLGRGAIGGLGGLAAMGGGMLLNLLPDFAGKGAAQSMLDYGGLGAMIGSVIPVIGTGIGGAIGAAIGLLKANWDEIAPPIGAAWTALGTFISGAVDTVKGWAATVGQFVSDWNPVSLVTNNWSSITGAVSSGLGTLGGWISDAMDTVTGWATSVRTWAFDSTPMQAVIGVWNTITGALGSFFSTFKGWIDTVAGWVGGLVETVGSLTDGVRNSRVGRWLGIDSGPSPAVPAPTAPPAAPVAPTTAPAAAAPLAAQAIPNNMLASFLEQQREQLDLIARLMAENNRLVREGNRVAVRAADPDRS